MWTHHLESSCRLCMLRGPEYIMVRELVIEEQDFLSFLMGMFMRQTSLVMTTEAGGLP